MGFRYLFNLPVGVTFMPWIDVISQKYKKYSFLCNQNTDQRKPIGDIMVTLHICLYYKMYKGNNRDRSSYVKFIDEIHLLKI